MFARYRKRTLLLALRTRDQRVVAGDIQTPQAAAGLGPVDASHYRAAVKLKVDYHSL